MAASALAAVGAAILASSLGVAGTIIGAAVVSIGATCGSALFQHVFHRTGEEIRSRVPAVAEPALTPEEWAAERRADAEEAFTKTAQFDPFDPGGEHTRMMARIAPPPENESVTVYKGRKPARKRTWKFYTLISGLVFVLAMIPIAITEFATGQTVGTTVWGGKNGSGSSDGVQGPSASHSTGGTGPGSAAAPSGSTGSSDPTAAPSRSSIGGGAGASSSPTPSASASATAAAPSASASATPSTGTSAAASSSAAP